MSFSLDAVALARSVLEGDSTAAAALTDFALEYHTSPNPAALTEYLSLLEGTVRECERYLSRGCERAQTLTHSGQPVDLHPTDCLLHSHELVTLMVSIASCGVLSNRLRRSRS